MKPSDAGKFAALMAVLGETYNKSITESVSEFYWDNLECFSWPDVEQAIRLHVNHPEQGEFMPKPSHIVRHIKGASDHVALKAWSKVSFALRSVGAYESVAFDDPIIHAVIRDMGGWIELCHTETKQAPFLSLEFQKRYKGYLDTPLSVYPSHVIGIMEANCQRYELTAPPQVKITTDESGNVIVSQQSLPHDTEQIEPVFPGLMTENQHSECKIAELPHLSNLNFESYSKTSREYVLNVSNKHVTSKD